MWLSQSEWNDSKRNLTTFLNVDIFFFVLKMSHECVHGVGYFVMMSLNMSCYFDVGLMSDEMMVLMKLKLCIFK